MRIKFFIGAIIGLMFSLFILPETFARVTDEFTLQKICKAAISQIMGRDPDIINTNLVGSSIVILSYVRRDDGTKWSYRCKVEGNRIIWASETGRWRTHPADAKLSYTISGKTLLIEEVFSDGSVIKKKFDLNLLK